MIATQEVFPVEELEPKLELKIEPRPFGVVEFHHDGRVYELLKTICFIPFRPPVPVSWKEANPFII